MHQGSPECVEDPQFDLRYLVEVFTYLDSGKLEISDITQRAAYSKGA